MPQREPSVPEAMTASSAADLAAALDGGVEPSEAAAGDAPSATAASKRRQAVPARAKADLPRRRLYVEDVS